MKQIYIAEKVGSSIIKLNKKVYICRSKHKKKNGEIIGWTKRGWVKLAIGPEIGLVHHSNLRYA